MPRPHLPCRSYAAIRHALLTSEELALVDLREEAPYAEAHPLFAVQLSLSRLELEAPVRIPRRTTPLTLYDNGEGLIARAAERLAELGYNDVAVLEGDLSGWQAAGGELFRDVNVPSKAFGEWVDAFAHTPSVSAEELKRWLDEGRDVVVLDARRFDEYQTMNIPGSTSVPGGELALRAATLAPNPQTHIVVNCAGRTRSIIGAQSLVNTGLPNPVSALRNGTIGWTLAGQALTHGQERRFADTLDEHQRTAAARAARAVANAAGVGRIEGATLTRWQADATRTTYVFDVRTPEEYAAGHVPGSRSVPGGQLVQETDHYAAVRGARIVLIDDDGVRANMSASWLAQMGWDAHVLDGLSFAQFQERGAWRPTLPPPPRVEQISPALLVEWLAAGDTVLLDFTASANHAARHIPGAWWALRSQLPEALNAVPPARRYVTTCGDGSLARFAAAELSRLTGRPAHLLEGGTAAWIDAGLPLEHGATRLASPRIDRYRRPYEGTGNAHEAMQAYLDWEYGLVAQLERDGTHGFRVVRPADVAAVPAPGAGPAS